MSLSESELYYSSIDRLDFNDENLRASFENFIELLKQRWDNLTEEDGIFLLKYYTKEGLRRLNVQEHIKIKVLDEKEMAHLYGYRDQNGRIRCADAVSLSQDKCIVFSRKLVKDLIGSDKNKAFRAARIALHETKHMGQFFCKDVDFDNYKIIMEFIAFNSDKDLYYYNYGVCSREIDAERFGLSEAAKCFPMLGIDQTSLSRELQKIKDRANSQKVLYAGRVTTQDGRIYRKGKEFSIQDKYRVYEILVAERIRQIGPKIFDKYPALLRGFNLQTGERKTDEELLDEMIEAKKELLNPTKSHELIKDIANIMIHRFSNDYQADIELINQYKEYFSGMDRAILDMVIVAKKDLNERKMTISKAEKSLKRNGVGLSKFAKLKRLQFKFGAFISSKSHKNKHITKELPSGSSVRVGTTPFHTELEEEQITEHQLDSERYTYRKTVMDNIDIAIIGEHANTSDPSDGSDER